MADRFGGVHRPADLDGAVLGGLAGGPPADSLGPLTPFWGATVAVGVLAVVAWKPLLITERSII